MSGLIIDNFAGGGGASTGIEAALGRAIDVAINHDEEAIRMHEVNHPSTRHIRNNIWQIDPRDVTNGEHVQLAWFSPDCKHFSKAKGGKPREKSIRDLAWIVVLWGQKVRPDVIMLENVEEFRTWGPLDHDGSPIKDRAGETFRKWCSQLRRIGYRLQFKELRACDYGAPTIRKRLFLIARCDGRPIVWPAPTHGKPGSPGVLTGKLKPWRTAAEIIDWSIPCPSIFTRKKELAEKTKRRIAHGIMKFVINNPRPFIVPLTHHGSDGRSYDAEQPLHTVTGANRGEMAVVTPIISYAQQGGANRSAEDPLHTVTASKKDHNCVVAAHVTKFRSGAIGDDAREPLATVTANSFIKRPGGAAPLGVVAATMVQMGYGEREGQEPRALNVEKPVGTVVSGGNKFGAVTAFMQKFSSGNAPSGADAPLQTSEGKAKHSLVVAHIEQANGGPNNETLAGRAAADPLSTIQTKGSQQRVVTSNLVKLRGTCQHGQPVDEPAPTISAQGTHIAEVRAFLLKYYGSDQDPRLGEPLHTVTSKDRFGLVTVSIEGEEYVIVDIGMRMLTPRELFNAQGFPPDYVIDVDARGKPITKTAQVAKCGNSVCPPMSEALTRAQFPEQAMHIGAAAEAA